MSQYQFKQLTVSSDDFTSGSKNQPVFVFNHSIDDLDYLQVTSAIIPFTYYVFSEGYTSMTVNGVAVSWAIGNYTPDEWIAVVSPQLPLVTITFSEITNKLTFSAGSTVSVVFNSAQLAWQHLGMIAGTNTNGTTSFTTPNVATFSGPNYMYLRSSLASVFNQESLIFSQSGRTGNNVLAIIPITENRNSIIFFNETRDRYFTWPTQGTKRLDLYFTLGQRLEPVNFNGEAFQVQFSSFSSLPANVGHT